MRLLAVLEQLRIGGASIVLLFIAGIEVGTTETIDFQIHEIRNELLLSWEGGRSS